jgi:hypothetical protein
MIDDDDEYFPPRPFHGVFTFWIDGQLVAKTVSVVGTSGKLLEDDPAAREEIVSQFKIALAQAIVDKKLMAIEMQKGEPEDPPSET